MPSSPGWGLDGGVVHGTAGARSAGHAILGAAGVGAAAENSASAEERLWGCPPEATCLEVNLPNMPALLKQVLCRGHFAPQSFVLEG